MVEYTVRIPMYVNVSKKTRAALNLNKYRNMHHQSSNNQKREFKRLMSPQIKALPRLTKVHIHYIINPKVKREFDVGNVASIVDKFFSDALVELGVLKDDNYKHIPSTSQQFGEFTHDEPHVIAVITDLKSKPERAKPMRILLDDNDFQVAVENYVVSKGIANYSGVSISVVDGKIEAEVRVDSLGTTSPNTVYKAPPGDPVPVTEPPVTSSASDVTCSEEDQRLELLAEAREAKIKGIRSDMKIETLREKLQEHNDEQTGGTANVDADSGSSDNGNSTGSALFETSGTESPTKEEPDNSANPSEASPEVASPVNETSEAGDVPPAEETVTEKPPAKKSSIFDVD